ncbi:unnamed protein product [Tilletia controversa]|nr:unnamed protein product [Tilletia controversa]
MAVTTSGPPPGLSRPPGLRTPPRPTNSNNHSQQQQQQQQHQQQPSPRGPQRPHHPRLPSSTSPAAPSRSNAGTMLSPSAASSQASAGPASSIAASADSQQAASADKERPSSRIYSEALMLHLSRSPLVNRPASMVPLADWFGEWKPFTATPRFHPGAQPPHMNQNRRDQTQQQESNTNSSALGSLAAAGRDNAGNSAATDQPASEERSFESWRRWHTRPSPNDGGSNERPANTRGFSSGNGAPSQRSKYNVDSKSSTFESKGDAASSGPFAAFAGSSGPDGKHVDPIQAFKAEMREKERLERERALGGEG